MNLEAELKLKELVQSPNIAELLSEEDLQTIGKTVYDEWQMDYMDRQPWEQKMAVALDLALQVAQEKTFPWAGASNVKFPLITIAALQYHARAYPALVPGPNLVKTYVFGSGEPEKEQAAQRISEHMSYQLLEEDSGWEEDHDRTLIIQPIIGWAIKKSFYDPSRGHNVSIVVHPKDFYVPYFTRALCDASRITEVLYMSHNAVREKIIRGIYCDHEVFTRPSLEPTNELEAQRQRSQGVNKPPDDPSQPYTMLEQHRWMDLDGDGYEEPYIVTIRRDTQQVMRIVARFDETSIKKRNGNIYHIKADEYYTKYSFIPSPDGGFYDLGFGALLGPLNVSIDTLINQLLDAGTLSNTAGGFLGRGVKIKKGQNQFQPFEWKTIDSPGEDLAKGIYPLPVREPSAVLFKLLELLITYGERIGSATDPMVGENPGQNTPAETSRNMIAEGMRILNGIYKRTYRAFKQEIQKLYQLNRIYLEDKAYFITEKGQKFISKEDYNLDPKMIRPAADPQMVSDSMKMQRASLIKQASMTTQGYNLYEVEKNYLEALGETDIERIFPDPKGPNAQQPRPNPKVQVEQMKQQTKMQIEQGKLKLAAAKLSQEAEVNRAKIAKMEAEVAALMAEVKSEAIGHKIALLNASIGAAKHKQDGIMDSLKILHDMQSHEDEMNANEQSGMGGMAPTSSN